MLDGSKTHRLIGTQLRCLRLLDQAFFKLENKIIANQKGMGTRVVLANFLQNLVFNHKITGQILIIAKQDKLAQWKELLDTWTSLNSIIYDDSDMNEGMENLRRWTLFYFDVTVKGRMTNRN